MRNFVRVVMCVGALCAATASAKPALAQECILGPVALPALSGPPVWFDPGGGGSWRPELHDPRWSGTPLRRLASLPSGGGSGTGDEAQVRALINAGRVYFSYQALTGGAPTALDAIYLAFKEGTANGAYAIEIAPFPGAAAGECQEENVDVPCAGTTPPPPSGGGAVPWDATLPVRINQGAVRMWHTTDATVASPTWTAEPDPTPQWLEQMALWTGSPGVAWGLTFIVDFSAATGINITGATKMFWGVKIDELAPTADIIVGNVQPATAATDVVNGDTIIPKSSGSWVDIENPGTCTGSVTLDRNDVGVWDDSSMTLTNTICAAVTGTCSASELTNIFRVTARGLNVPAPAAWAIRARVRIAEWGSTVADRKFGLWKDIPGSNPTGTAILTGDPAPFTSLNGWTWNSFDNGDGTSDVQIDYECKLQGADTFCPKLGAGTDDHQCMLVELGQRTTGAGAQRFQDVAVYRNMNYLHLSTASKPATISIAGFQGLTGVAQDRDVYLHLETSNMPAHGTKAMALPARDMDLARRIAEHHPRPPKRNPQGDLKGLKAGTPAKPAPAVPPNRASVLAARLASDTGRLGGKVAISSVLSMTGSQIMDSVWPTYRVRVYADSGKTFTAKGTTRKVLVPMVPFGFHLSHDGAFYGFSELLAGLDGVTVEPLTDNWYVVRKVKNEGSFRVQTTITAEENPKGQTNPCPTCNPCPACKPEHGGHCNCRIAGAGTRDDLGVALAGFFAVALGTALRRRARRRRR